MILKRKIAKVRRLLQARQRRGPMQRKDNQVEASYSRDLPEITYQETLKLKNVYKNYTRAICSFILSKIAIPYFPHVAEEEKFDLEGFRNYIKEKRHSVRGIIELRGLLIIEEKDDDKLRSYKTVFRDLAESFIKYFSVNWISGSKLEYKLDYLKFRYRLLRRIKNPEMLSSRLV